MCRILHTTIHVVRSAVFLRVCDRKIRVRVGTSQCSDGHRESRPRSGKPAVESVTEGVRTCHGQYYEQVPELHCGCDRSSRRFSSVPTQVISLQVAAQQHESNIVRHYTTLLAQESQPTGPEFGDPAATTMPLFHLSHNLRALIRTMAGRAEPDSPRQEEASKEEAKADGSPPEDPQDTESDEALLALIEDHDWTVDRETEIQRLEVENERLRKMLGIDEASAREHGLLADEERERDRYLSSGSSSSLSTRSASTSTSFSSSSFRTQSTSTSLSASTSTTSLLSTPSTTPGSSMIPRSPRPPPSGLMLNNPPALNLAPPPTLNLLRNPENQPGGPQQQQHQQQQHQHQQQQQQQQGSLGRGGAGAAPPRVAGVFGQRLAGRGGAPPAPWFSGGGGSIIHSVMTETNVSGIGLGPSIPLDNGR